MKTLTISISSIIIVVTILAGLILKDFHKENVIASACVIMVNAALLLAVAEFQMKDSFKVSFFILFPFFCLIEYILAILSPCTFDNNYYVIGIICCFAFQLILFFTGIMRR